MSNRFTQWKYRYALAQLLPTFGFNHDLGVMKSLMGELTDSTNRAKAYAFVSLVCGFGVAVGFVGKLFYLIIQFFD